MPRPRRLSRGLGGVLERVARRRLAVVPQWRYRSVPLSVGHPGVLRSDDLAGREAIHARVVRVVHEVLDRVESCLAGAAVATGRAAEGRRCLCRCVADVVALTRAAALERVVEPEPVPRLVGRGVTQVVGRGVATLEALV